MLANLVDQFHTPDYLAYSEAIDNMKNGQCDAVFVTSGLPNATVMELGTQYDMVVVPIDGAGRDKLVSDYPYYAKSVIPANTYNNTEDVEGVFVYNIMLVREDLPNASRIRGSIIEKRGHFFHG